MQKTLSVRVTAVICFVRSMPIDLEDLGVASLQCGRSVDSLKWFLDWKFFGREGLAARVEKKSCNSANMLKTGSSKAASWKWSCRGHLLTYVFVSRCKRKKQCF